MYNFALCKLFSFWETIDNENREVILNMDKLKWNEVKITDEFFGVYIKQVSEKILWYQWNVLNDNQIEASPTYCIENFKIASGQKTGKIKGVVFQDTDLYKWLEAVAYCIGSGNGLEFVKIADDVIDLIEAAQEEDGYLNTYYTVKLPDKKWTNLVEGHELYTAGHMIEAAVAYFEATGKRKFLDVAEKNAKLICKIFGINEGQKRGYPGHQEIELALIKLYRVTKNKQYLQCAKYFIDERGKTPNYLQNEFDKRGTYEHFSEFIGYDASYAQAGIQPVHQTVAEGHSVRFTYMCSAMADLAYELGDKELLNACELLWENMTKKQMYVTGSIGSSGFLERFTTDYDLPNNTNYSETCASIGIMMFGQRMTKVTEDASYYDVVEKALYNTVLAGINLEGDRYFYVNPLEVVPEFCTDGTYMKHIKPERQVWFDVACCPTNVARTLASLSQYIYAKNENSLFINQFISSQAQFELLNENVNIDIKSNLLKDGVVEVNVNKNGEEDISLFIRIPEYSKDTKIFLNGKSIDCSIKNNYAHIIVNGKDSNVIRIEFEVKAKWISSNPNLRANVGKIALVKGPMVYCLEEIDNENNLASIYVNTDSKIEEIEPIESFPADIPVMKFDAMKLSNNLDENGELYGVSKFVKKDVELKAIPYCLWNNRGVGEMIIWLKAIV